MVLVSRFCDRCGAANDVKQLSCFACQHPLSLVPTDDTLLQGRYRLLHSVGTGGFGAVYKAEDTQKQNQLVAIKQINLSGLNPQQTIEATDAFNREMLLLTDLVHPHLPCMHSHFTDPDHWYLVMDFIDGETLEDYLEAHPGPGLDDVLDLALQLCDVLAYLHSQEPAIIFRDLKPTNIMRTGRGQIYLIDFGISRRYKPGKPKDTLPFGSPGYAAPEQYGRAQTTPRADIYSLGALLHFLLTDTDPSEQPFTFAPLRMYGPVGISELADLVTRMVALDVEQRPSSIEVVRDELQQIVEWRAKAEPRVWRPEHLPKPLPVPDWSSLDRRAWRKGVLQQQQLFKPQKTSFSTRRKFLIGSLGATAALIGLPLVYEMGTYVFRSDTQDQSLSSSNSEIATPQPYATVETKAVLTVPEITALSCAPNGTSIALGGSARSLSLWIDDALHQVENVKRGNASVVSLSWSDDSEMVGFVCSDNSIWIYTIRTATFLQEIHCAGPATLIWSDKHWYYTVASSTTIDLFQLDAQGGRPIRSIRIAEAFLKFIWSPQKQYIVNSGDENELSIWSPWSGQKIRSMHIAEGILTLAWSPDARALAVVLYNAYIGIWSMNGESGKQKSLITSIEFLAWSPDGRYIIGANSNEVNLFSKDLDLLLRFQLDSELYIAMVWSPDSKKVLFPFVNGQVQEWMLPAWLLEQS